MRIRFISALFVAAISLTGSAQTQAESRSQGKELLARDINGYELGMTVEQVTALAHKPLTPLGGGYFKLSADGVDYDFEFSILGHLFLVNSVQGLGYFIPDAAFSRSLTDKLSKKFGTPQGNQLPEGPVQWGWRENVRDHPNDPPYSRPTVELSALLLGGYGQPITLHMHLIDFRIMRRDIETANAKPRSKAETKTKF
jgi:hypothetical protein